MDTQTATPDTSQQLDIAAIMSILPHRFPFLLIDRVVEVVRRERIAAIKNVTINEPFFQGHFPGYPVMPGVLVIEAMAQAGACLLLTEFPDRDEHLAFFTGIERAKFRRPVVPGDQIRFEVKVLNWRSKACRMEGTATVEGKLACEAVIMCQLVPRQRQAAAPPLLRRALSERSRHCHRCCLGGCTGELHGRPLLHHRAKRRSRRGM